MDSLDVSLGEVKRCQSPVTRLTPSLEPFSLALARPAMRRSAAILLTLSSASGMMLAARAPTRVPAVRMAYTDVVRAAQERAAAVKADQDATIAAMATGFTGFFALPTIDNLFADLFLSTVIAGVIGVVAGFREDGLGDAARAVGGGVSKAVGTVAGPAIDKAKDLAGDGLRSSRPQSTQGG